MVNKMLGSYAFRELSRRTKRYLLNMMIVALVVIMLITLNSLGAAYKETAKLPFEKIHSSIIVQKNGNVPENTTGVVTSCSLAPIGNNVLDEIKNIDGVNDVSEGLFLWVFDTDNFKRVLGVNWSDSLGAKIKANLIDGELPSTDEALVDKTYAEQYNISIGKKIKISGRNFTVSGIGKTSGKDVIASDIFVNLGASQQLAYSSENLQKTESFGQNDINIIFVDAEQTKVSEVAESLNEILNPQILTNGKTPTGKTIGIYTIYTPKSFENQISSLFFLSAKLIWFISLITVIGCMLIIIKSMSYGVMQRKKEFGIMKSVGFTNKDIQREIATETMIQVFSGYILGIVGSLILIIMLGKTKISISIPWELNPYPHFLATNPTLVNTVQTYFLPIQFQLIYAGVSFLVVVLIGMLTVLVITKNINKLKAMEVLKNE
jgi:ABC-type antimicrobial peptide transport system permease subunit